MIYRIKRCPAVEKKIVFEWIKGLAVQISRYHRCRNGQCYRYINPYSVLVTKDDKIMLLDLEAESNLFVLRSMQKRAMRKHFVKPIVHNRESAKLSLDLYGFGKTVQFILASTCAEPLLSRREEHRLAKIIGKCLNEDPKKQYEDFKQVEKELPAVKHLKKQKKKRWYVVIPAVGILGVLILVYLYLWGTIADQRKQIEEGQQEQTVSSCTELKEERVREIRTLAERFPGLKESECYLLSESENQLQEEAEWGEDYLKNK